MSGDNEQTLIDRIQRAIPSRLHRSSKSSAALRQGIGDDAALIGPSRGMDLVLTCDAFIEDVHFIAGLHPADCVGYKSLARATSDLAAMGATPRFFLLTLALPAKRTEKWLDEFLRGMSRAAREYGLVLAGGDIARHSSVAISITVIGEVAASGGVTRSGGRPGDLVYVSGTLGAAQLGLQLIRTGELRHSKERERLLRQQCYPQIRIALGKFLAKHHLPSAMMDLSDGLSTDLARLCAASSVGARIVRERIPAVEISPALRARGLDAMNMALHGGEDYELLFTVPRRKARKVPARHGDARITCIGEITRVRDIVLVGKDGRTAPLPALGWDHFRR